MSVEVVSRRLETAHLVVGYAMSRLNLRFLATFGFPTWTAAFDEVGQRLSAPPNSIKGLRDEFDPLFPWRRGWADRDMHPSRQKVAAELAGVSDAALVELVRALLRPLDEEATEALDALAPTTGIPAAAAERLLTGRRAEEFLIENTQPVLGLPRAAIIDARESMLGFDFRVRDSDVVVEVKGMKALSGQLLFTDREWREANVRRSNYCLVVVANLVATPRAQVVADPASSSLVRATCRYERALRPMWSSAFVVS